MRYLFSSIITLTTILLSYSAVSVAEAPSPLNTSATITQTLLGLGVVLVMIFALVWLLKRVGYGGYQPSNMMKVKASLPLSHKEKLILVDVAGEQLLIGVAPGFVGHIKSLDKLPAAQPAAVAEHSLQKINPTFADVLTEKLKVALKKGEKP